MDYEFYELLENGTLDEVCEYLSCYGKRYWNSKRKCYEVMNRRFYPIFEDGFVIGWEED